MAEWGSLHQSTLPIQVFLALYKTNATLVRQLEEKLSSQGLTLGRLCLLVLLQRSERPMQPSELGDDLAVTRANVSGLLKALEAVGMVTREIDPANRRQVFVRLTPVGRAALVQAWPIYVEAVNGGLDVLTTAEQATLLDLLQKLTHR